MLVGFSRKSSLGGSLDPEATHRLVAASLGAAVAAFERGATILRVHDVREHVEALAAAPERERVMTIELHGLELHGHHGVLEEERRAGQRFLFDVELEVGEAGSADRIEDAVDYREVAACVREVSDGRAFDLLEALAAAVADELLARFPVERAVRVRKPDACSTRRSRTRRSRATRP